MFLSEGYVTEQTSEMGYDPVYAMQVMQEATDDWNDICMKMIKLEHTAIMKEDAELLKKGAKEALTRFKTNINTLAKKLLEFLERVYVQWTKIQASVASKFLGQKKLSLLKACDDVKNIKKKATVEFDQNKWKLAISLVNEFTKDTQKTSNAIANDKIEEVHTIEAKWVKFTEEDKDKKAVPVTKALVEEAVKLIEKRADAVRAIQGMKKAVVALQKIEISRMDKNNKASERNKLVDLQRSFNKMIIAINKMTTMAVKICKSVSAVKNEAPASDSSAKTATAKEKAEAEEEAKAEGLGESVLDLFA